MLASQGDPDGAWNDTLRKALLAAGSDVETCVVLADARWSLSGVTARRVEDVAAAGAAPARRAAQAPAQEAKVPKKGSTSGAEIAVAPGMLGPGDVCVDGSCTRHAIKELEGVLGHSCALPVSGARVCDHCCWAGLG